VEGRARPAGHGEPAMKADDLERALATILEPMGVRALGQERKVEIDAGRDQFRIRLALPQRYVDVRIDREDRLSTEAFGLLALERIERSARVLFRDTIDHIAKHDRSPIDRVKEIEAAARSLLDAMKVHLDDIRMPYGSSAAVVNAAYKLRQLVEMKTGAAAWGRNGYGEDPPEAQR
jgi:hypothetical protein